MIYSIRNYQLSRHRQKGALIAVRDALRSSYACQQTRACRTNRSSRYSWQSGWTRNSGWGAIPKHLDVVYLSSIVKTTRYFREQVLRKRPYIQKQWCVRIIKQPIKKELQPDGRIRHWGYNTKLKKYLRVITLEDGQTIHNAFPDRNFRQEVQ